MKFVLYMHLFIYQIPISNTTVRRSVIITRWVVARHGCHQNTRTRAAKNEADAQNLIHLICMGSLEVSRSASAMRDSACTPYPQSCATPRPNALKGSIYPRALSARQV